MRRLIAGIIISLLMILFGATILVGLTVLLFSGLIILGLLIASPFIVLHYAKNKKLGPAFGWTALVVVIMTVIGIGILWWRSPPKVPKAPITGTQTVLPAEEWVFEWSTSPNKGRPFEVKIDKLDSESLWFTTPYMCGETMRIATYILTKSGDGFTGSWSQNYPKDSGTLFLKEDGYQRYLGQITDAENKTAVITLRRK